MVWLLGLKNPGQTDRGVATGVTKFHMASGGLNIFIMNKSINTSFLTSPLFVSVTGVRKGMEI